MDSQLLQQARDLIKTGHRSEARRILTRQIDVDPYDVIAWFWLAETMGNDDQRIAVLEQCLRFNPENHQAQTGLRKLTTRQTIAPPPDVPPSPPASPKVEPNPFTTSIDLPDLSQKPIPVEKPAAFEKPVPVKKPAPVEKPVNLRDQPKQPDQRKNAWIPILLILGTLLILGISILSVRLQLA